MTITVKGYLTLRYVMENRACIDIDFRPMTIRDLLIVLAKKYGPDFRAMVFEDASDNIGIHIRVLVNGRHYGTLPNKLDTMVEDGDEIGIFPPVAGG